MNFGICLVLVLIFEQAICFDLRGNENCRWGCKEPSSRKSVDRNHEARGGQREHAGKPKLDTVVATVGTIVSSHMAHSRFADRQSQAQKMALLASIDHKFNSEGAGGNGSPEGTPRQPPVPPPPKPPKRSTLLALLRDIKQGLAARNLTMNFLTEHEVDGVTTEQKKEDRPTTIVDSAISSDSATETYMSAVDNKEKVGSYADGFAETTDKPYENDEHINDSEVSESTTIPEAISTTEYSRLISDLQANSDQRPQNNQEAESSANESIMETTTDVGMEESDEISQESSELVEKTAEIAHLANNNSAQNTEIQSTTEASIITNGNNDQKIAKHEKTTEHSDNRIEIGGNSTEATADQRNESQEKTNQETLEDSMTDPEVADGSGQEINEESTTFLTQPKETINHTVESYTEKLVEKLTKKDKKKKNNITNHPEISTETKKRVEEKLPIAEKQNTADLNHEQSNERKKEENKIRQTNNGTNKDDADTKIIEKQPHDEEHSDTQAQASSQIETIVKVTHDHNKTFKSKHNNQTAKPTKTENKTKVYRPQYRPQKRTNEINVNNVGLEAYLITRGKPTMIFVDNLNRIALELHRASAPKYPRQNMVLSPMAITSSLAMLYLGARGATADQLDSILAIDQMNTFNPHIGFFKFMRYINNLQPRGTTAICNILLKDQLKSEIFDGYKSILQRFYKPAILEINIRNAAAILRQTMERCTRSTSKGAVNLELGSDPPVPSQGPLMAASVSYFNLSLSPALTVRPVQMQFLRFPSALRRVLLTAGLSVNGRVDVGYSREQRVTIAALPMAGRQLQLLLLLPGNADRFSADGLSQLEARLTPSVWTGIIRSTRPRLARLRLPVISHRTNADLRQFIIENAGTAATDPAHADFSGINGIRDLQLALFTHTAELHVGDQKLLHQYANSTNSHGYHNHHHTHHGDHHGHHDDHSQHHGDHHGHHDDHSPHHGNHDDHTVNHGHHDDHTAHHGHHDDHTAHHGHHDDHTAHHGHHDDHSPHHGHHDDQSPHHGHHDDHSPHHGHHGDEYTSRNNQPKNNHTQSITLDHSNQTDKLNHRENITETKKASQQIESEETIQSDLDNQDNVDDVGNNVSQQRASRSRHLRLNTNVQVLSKNTRRLLGDDSSDYLTEKWQYAEDILPWERSEEIRDNHMLPQLRTDTDVWEINFERAFLYAVRHKSTGAIIATGRYTDPDSYI